MKASLRLIARVLLRASEWCSSKADPPRINIPESMRGDWTIKFSWYNAKTGEETPL